MQNIDAYIDAVTTGAALDSGIPREILQARNKESRFYFPRMVSFRVRKANAMWTEYERGFLLEHIGLMMDGEIGTALGRSRTAVKIKRTRWGLPAHSKRPGWLTGNGAAKVLGQDVHAITKLENQGILPCVRIPGERGILNIRRMTLYRWAVNPENWIYFKRAKVTDSHLRTLIERKAERWGDEWWTAGQVRDYLGLGDDRRVNYLLVRKGMLWGKKWGNWWFRRSVVTRPEVIYPFGRGHGHEVYFSPEQDDFIVLARAVGCSNTGINQMMKWDRGADSSHRWLSVLREQIASGEWRPAGVQANGYLVFADWHQHRDRFPAVARAMVKFGNRQRLSWREIYIVRGVLAKWMDWFKVPGPHMVSTKWAKRVAVGKLEGMARALKAKGLDPIYREV